MAQLPTLKRLAREDYSSITTISAFVAKLFDPLNSFLNSVYSAFANGLTLDANTLGQVSQSTSVKADATGVATTTINWKYPQSPPRGVVVMACSLTKDGTGLATNKANLQPLVSWSYNAGVVSLSLLFVKASSGALVVDASGTYSLVFYLTGG